MNKSLKKLILILTIIMLSKDFIASDWTQRLGLSDHFKEKFKVSEDELSKKIVANFN